MKRSDSRSPTMNWFRHAFAVEKADSVALSESDRLLIDRICSEVVRRRLTAPALLLLEINRPLNYVSAQALHFFEPIVSVLTDADGYRAFARFLEQRGSIDYLVSRIDSPDRRSTTTASDSEAGGLQETADADD